MKKIGLVASLMMIIVLGFVPTNAYAQNPDSTRCFQNFAQDMDSCSYLGTWWERSLCGADAELELTSCIGSAISPWK
jgi:hypothetical protein